MSFMHGIETIEEAKGLRSVVPSPTCVIGLVGTAPGFLGTETGGKPTVVTNYREAAMFGPDIRGYTIPNALKRILAYGSAMVIVVDVFNKEKHTKAIEGETLALSDCGEGKLANQGLADFTLTMNGVELRRDVDYTLDTAAGTIKRIKAGAIPPAGANLLAAYTCADFAKVLTSEIIGGCDITGAKTGMLALYDTQSTLGVKARLLIAPGFAAAGSAAGAALVSAADKLRGRALLDVPYGVTVAEAIQGRGEGGIVNLGVSSGRAELCYPYVKILDDNEEIALEPLSQHLAGLASSVDAREGYWVSVSNHELTGIIGLDQPVDWSLNDPNCEANRLNAVGITTVVRPFGSGFRAWGNRSAAFPTDTHPLNFNCVRNVADIIHDAVESAMLPWIDKPLNKPVLEAIRESILAFLDACKNKGAILGGSFDWPPEDNPIDELALGHATYALSFLPPTPLERVTVKSSIDTAWLKKLYE
jgi:phage tail sheath protein FI